MKIEWGYKNKHYTYDIIAGMETRRRFQFEQSQLSLRFVARERRSGRENFQGYSKCGAGSLISEQGGEKQRRSWTEV